MASLYIYMLLVAEYLAFTFLACLGMLQWVALRQRLQGLCFLSSPPWGYGLSLLLMVGSFVWFFLGRDRIRPGLEGLQQFLLFSLAALLAVAVTLVASSLLLRRRGINSAQGELQGLKALRNRTYFQALNWDRREKNTGQS